MDISKKPKNMELKKKPKGEKVYRGAYSYFRGENMYSEEEFEVWKDKKELGLNFFSRMHSRVATGELLTIYVDYVVSKDFIPQHLFIERALGKDLVTEIYDFNKKNNTLDYLFINKDGQEHQQIVVNPKFHITTPCTVCSMLFLKSKKEDTTAKNYYSIVQSHNQWKYEHLPVQTTITMQRQGVAAENIQIDGQTVQGTNYKLWQEIDQTEDVDFNLPAIYVTISKHNTIPYLIRGEDGTRVQIKYLNDLNKDAI